MAQKRKKQQKFKAKNEIAGIIIVGLAIFCAITIYFNMDSVFGNVVKSFIFGVFGLLGFIIPLLLGVIGVLMIIASNKKPNRGKLFLTFFVVFLLFSLMHLPAISAGSLYSEGMGYGAFLGGSYSYGVAAQGGGGVMGALLTFWSYRFIGLAGSYVAFVIGIAACILVLFNLSIKSVSKDIGRVVKTSYDEYRTKAEERRENRRLYVERLAEEEDDEEDFFHENEFDMRIQPTTPEEIIQSEPMAVPEAEPYDPQSYREMFADTDIEFEDDEPSEEKVRRKIDLSATTAKIPNVGANGQKQTDSKKKKYIGPPLNLLHNAPKKAQASSADLQKNVGILESTLESFNVSARVVNVSRGPVVTRYELQPSPGVKVSKIVNLADDIAMNLAARDVRIEAPVPGKPVVGIEIPNTETSAVALKELVSSKEFKDVESPVAFALGKDIAGKNIYADIAKMPHMLIAGATGSGKSVCINSLIVSILYHSTPEDVRMIMIDPKVVELAMFNDIPHLLIPVVTDPKKASSAINWAVNEMTLRYRMFAAKGAKDLKRYNKIMIQEEKEKLPQILVIIDELADLMMVAPGEVEDAICRIAQLGRASGIHLVIATQRPSVDVITGIIKANIPSRVAFAVSSQVDSRTILDMVGAEKLLGQGDMLYYPIGAPKPVRVQGCFISDKEVEAVTTFLKDRSNTEYDSQVMEKLEKSSVDPIAGQEEKDELFDKAVETVLEYDQASTSMLQRRLRVGYARAARLIDQLEESGIVSPPDGAKPRQVLISKAQYYGMTNASEEDDEI